MLTVSTPSNAQQEQTVPVRTFLSFRPTTIGLGQELLINVWISPAPGANRQYHDLKITATKPDGTQTSYSMDTYVADGTLWLPWIVDQVGEWFFQIDYPGEYFAAGTYYEGKIVDAAIGGTVYADGAIVKPASTGVQKLTVQEEVIPVVPESPLPTDYWTRPVGEENRNWWPIIGNYPWWGDGSYDVTGTWDYYNLTLIQPTILHTLLFHGFQDLNLHTSLGNVNIK
jgi:hypothetical protein